MKYAILFILLLGIVATACKDEMFTGQTPVDGVAPLQIKNPEVINVEGGALITYDLPDEEDLLYKPNTNGIAEKWRLHRRRCIPIRSKSKGWEILPGVKYR